MHGDGLHGCYAGEDGEDLVVVGGGDCGVEKEFVHFWERVGGVGEGMDRLMERGVLRCYMLLVLNGFHYMLILCHHSVLQKKMQDSLWLFRNSMKGCHVRMKRYRYSFSFLTMSYRSNNLRTSL